VCAWILCRTVGYCRTDILFRANHLGQSTRSSTSLGMVYMGYALFAFCPFSRVLIQSKKASVNFLDGTKIEQQRILLAVYPLL
jgi:hypothetical protein